MGLEDQEDREAAAAIAAANGVPTSVTVFIGPILIGHGSRAFEEMGHATDGKGIDHFDPLYDDLLIEALCEVDPANDLCSAP